MSASPSRPPLWFWIGIGCVWVFALAFRFWGLERFNTLVFDEVYFAKFGHHYLTQTEFFDAHPPLGKYLIALGIALKGFNPWGFRWINALVGATIPLILAGMAYQLSKRPSYALIAAVLTSLDGLLLVESRYALLNVHILFFGLLAHWLVLIALNHKGHQRNGWLAAAGASFGATIAVKWNGLGFLLGLYLLWGGAKFCRSRFDDLKRQTRLLPIQRLSELTWLQLFGYLPAIALFTYSLLWIPHLAQNPDFNFWQVHKEIFSYHRYRVGGADVHPYCSAWYTWPLLLKPISYFYQLTRSPVEPLPVTGPPLPQAAANWIYSVYATGNPILWWACTIAILFLLAQGGQQIWHRLAPPIKDHQALSSLSEEQVWISCYVGVNYLANYLPWIGVSRCTFLYHYMPASMFSSLALAWLMNDWLYSPDRRLRAFTIILLLASVFSFIICLPLYLGLPLSPWQWQLLRGQWLG
ncbi:phospholipid carrier-dependent glycosyltransferase [Acaryochloris sp. IP29b_bin.137]|uniref:phospholipid carrier-dependent glycosyltransferase n=1 Tax=Acaryochloris sp. IP29b_bin.137 TaxID=2969217 RepID=UPI00260C57B7|nr:phospholipid carrier-dependent glycosyltransferase [Acaryochloris sp. IP29b_bin.137]